MHNIMWMGKLKTHFICSLKGRKKKQMREAVSKGASLSAGIRGVCHHLRLVSSLNSFPSFPTSSDSSISLHLHTYWGLISLGSRLDGLMVILQIPCPILVIALFTVYVPCCFLEAAGGQDHICFERQNLLVVAARPCNEAGVCSPWSDTH